MRETEFREWLEANGANSVSGRNTRVYAVKTIESNLGALGFSQSDLDAISIAVPNYLHHPLALKAFEAGLHVLCEKPIAMTAAQGDEMAADQAAVPSASGGGSSGPSTTPLPPYPP